jgi:3-deoxy-7-phosphoheptulonate synthase
MNKLRTQAKHSLIAPAVLFDEYPLSLRAEETVLKTRQSVEDILQGRDDRLLVIVGPCSIHDSKAALEYANLLKEAITRFEKELCIVMRVYFEKPRTTVGWKGLISDPELNGSFEINDGLRLARKLLLKLNEMSVPAATEFLDPMVPQFLSDLISWSAIGARTSASPLHRELASGLSMPVGFKNTVDGNIGIAIDAVRVAALSHHYLSIDENGLPVIINTLGNEHGHIILRGGLHNTNYHAHDIAAAASLLKAANLIPRLIVDCSHGNSVKDYRRQKNVIASLITQIEKDSKTPICGIMLESHLVSGKQTLDANTPLTYGQSITDECLSWEETLPLLEQLASTKKNKFIS